MQYFLNGLPSFKLPGKYPLGKQIDDPNSVRLRIDLLLHHNNLALQKLGKKEAQEVRNAIRVMLENKGLLKPVKLPF